MIMFLTGPPNSLIDHDRFTIAFLAWSVITVTWWKKRTSLDMDNRDMVAILPDTISQATRMPCNMCNGRWNIILMLIDQSLMAANMSRVDVETYWNLVHQICFSHLAQPLTMNGMENGANIHLEGMPKILYCCQNLVKNKTCTIL